MKIESKQLESKQKLLRQEQSKIWGLADKYMHGTQQQEGKTIEFFFLFLVVRQQFLTELVVILINRFVLLTLYRREPN